MKQERRWYVFLVETGLSFLIVPFLVAVGGLIIQGRFSDPQIGLAGVLGVSFLFGLAQFGLACGVAGVLCAGVVVLVGRRSLPTRLAAATLPPIALFPVAATVAIVISNSGHVPLIQDTVPYSQAAALAGLLVGLITLLLSSPSRTEARA